MELKQCAVVVGHVVDPVLIVPSGIETCLHPEILTVDCVLIVPSGIETRKSILVDSCLLVLIVPSGIETALRIDSVCVRHCINCT